MPNLLDHSRQKGGLALILIIVVIALAGLGVGGYLITQKTSWFSNAGSAQITIPYMSPSPTGVPSASQQSYENPFDEAASYENPFEAYQNPFENL